MLVEALRDHAIAKGLTVEVHWLRFNHFFTKPLLVVCRILGLTRYEVVNGHRIGKHNFGSPRFLARWFESLQYLDAQRVARTYLAKQRRAHCDLIILDRFIMDIIVDISVATDEPTFPHSTRIQRFIELMPTSTVTLGVQREQQALFTSRPESAVDPSFIARVRAYEELFARDDVKALNNNGSPADLISKALREIAL